MDCQILLKIKPKVNAMSVLIRDDHYFINKYSSLFASFNYRSTQYAFIRRLCKLFLKLNRKIHKNTGSVDNSSMFSTTGVF